MKRANKIIISGGGSGGHIFPALAIAKALKKIDHSIDILFIGAKGKIEMEKVPKAGFPIEGLWISGFHRKKMWRNILFPFKLLHSIFKASALIRKFKPAVVVGVGGFASGPTLYVASRKSIPTLIQEQNSYPGMTNKLLAKKVDMICGAYTGLERWFPKEKIKLLGNPVRENLFEIQSEKEEALQHFGFKKNKQVIIMIGGSLGASSFNKAMKANADFFKANPQIQFLWQCGKLYYEEYRSCETALLPNVKISAFIDKMDLAYTMADLIIARAGAGTIAELMVIGKPVILVPSPNVAEDHQTPNAQALVDKDAALLVPDSKINEDLFPTALDLLQNKSQAAELGKQIKKLQVRDAAEKIAQEVLALIPKSAGV